MHLKILTSKSFSLESFSDHLSCIFDERSTTVNLCLCLLHHNVRSSLMFFPLPLLRPSTKSQWLSCQNKTDIEADTMMHVQYVCVAASCIISSLCWCAFFVVSQGPWQQGGNYMVLMAHMHPWLWTLLMDQCSTKYPNCPHEFTPLTRHSSGACISASLHDPRAGGDGW